MDPISKAYTQLQESDTDPDALHKERVRRLVEILRPAKGTGEPYFHDDEHPDLIGPDEPIRAAIKDALKELDVSGSGGCRLCQS